MAGPGFVPKWLRRNARVAPKRTSWPDKPRNQRWIDFFAEHRLERSRAHADGTTKNRGYRTVVG